MHISKVIIEGFKSYRNKTVLHIEPGLNVIVGRNGAGKTNLFFAIQFVLSNEYQNLPQRERLNLLHASSGLRATSAYVEIIFNNEDRRLPEEGDVVRLRREITQTKDVYSLNGHTIGKTQVQHTLQSAGLSKVNPYYIIKQGRINDLALATIEKRLALLSEIAGSLVWEELRPRDKSLLNDSEKQICELEKLICEVEKTLETLKKDEEDYRQWLGINTHKRVLEFLLCKKEHTRTVNRIAQLRTQLNEAHAEEKTFRAETERVEKENLEAEKIVKSHQFEFRSAQDKLNNLTDLVQELASEHSRLELELPERRKRLVADNGELLRNNLKAIDKEILLKKEELARISESYDAALKEEYEINTRLMLNEQRRQELFAKLGRESSFASVEERNEWIREEQRKLTNLIGEQSKQLEDISNDIADEESIAKTLGIEIDKLEMEKSNVFESVLTLNTKKQEAELEQRRLQMLRNELWRKEREAQDELQLVTQSWEQAMNSFQSVVPGVATGLEFMASTLQRMREVGEGSFAYNCALAYRGLFIDQFSCDEEISSAIDAVAGGRLFHHVVDTDVAASEIIRQINMQRLPGSYVFFAHNRLDRKNVGSINDENAVPMIRVLKHISDGMMVVMEQVFGRVLICKDYDSALLSARRYDIDCVTLEGDVVKRSGVLSGGYYSPNRSRTKLYFRLRETQKLRETKKSELKEVQEEIRNADSLFIDNANTLQRIEIKISNAKLNLMEEDLKKLRRGLAVSMQALEAKNALSRKLTMSLQANRAKIESLGDELLHEFASELAVDERTEVVLLNQEIQQAQKMFQNVNGRRMELESQKNVIESKLSDHLLKKKSDLEQAIQEKSASGLNATEANLQVLKNMETHLNKLQTKLHKSRDEMADIEAKIAETSKKVVEAETELEVCQNRKLKQQAVLDKQIEIANKICQSIDRNETNEKTYSEQLKSFGTFEEESEKEVLNRCSNYDMKRLEKELTKVNDRLKGCKDINQKATIEYTFNKNALDELNHKLYRYHENQMACEELVESVESQKNDAIQYSLLQVAKSFRSMFRTLVPPPAIGYMNWIYGDGDDDDSGSDIDEEPRVPDVNRLRGISVNVSFTGESNIRDLNSLSGGQRSIVSLALVFAILMMDRAPFYLLDEADMALDTVYRSKVAAMVSRFSRRSQFIATTFRSEFLEHADNIIGVTYDAAVQTSRATSISKAEATDFVSHGSESSDSAKSRSPISSSTVSLL